MGLTGSKFSAAFVGSCAGYVKGFKTAILAFDVTNPVVASYWQMPSRAK
jgi:hypothetical protein